MRKITVVLIMALLIHPAGAATRDTGRIEGRVTNERGRPLPGVRVMIDDTSLSTHTDADGRYSLTRVAAGTCSLTFRWRGETATRSDVTVETGSTTTIDEVVSWEVGLSEQVTVTVSRRPERIVDAPASVTVITADEIERQASHGQVPKLFEFEPGVEITQINMVEFLVSTRGFNSTLNRRVAVQVDGRDLTDPFIGAMEWSTVSYPLDDFSTAELVRGPAAALYGANATGGIFNLTTKRPQDHPGGVVRLAAGEESSSQVDFRWAGGMGGGWYTKVAGGMRKTDGFSVSRQFETEYSMPCTMQGQTECLPLENIAFPEGNEIDIVFGNVRFDKHLSNGTLLTVEGGTTDYQGPVFISNGRGQINDVERPWGRLNASAEHWNVLVNYSKRDAMATNLVTTLPFLLDADNLKFEAQTNWNFVDDTLRLVAGGSWIEENVDSNVMGGPESIDEQALFAQADWDVNRHVKLVGALRWDDSSLFDPRVSPRGSVVFGISPAHSVRLTYNEGFQLPTYADFFLQFPIFPTDTTPLNDICMQAAYNIDCGLGGLTTNYVFGNEALDLEQVKTLELGYKGVLANRAFLIVDLWDSEYDDFVTLSPQLTPAGRTNAAIAPWVGPAASETTPIAPADCPVPGFPGGTVADCVRASAQGSLGGGQLTNLDGSPIIALFSSTNFGKVDARGADVGLDFFFNRALRLSFSYSWFDFEVQKDTGGNPALLLPNTPKNKASFGLSYVVDRWDATIRGRWVDEFFWSGTPAGTVESYTTVDLYGNYALSDHWKVGLNVANLLEDEHWEAFGGDVLGRRALTHVTFSW